VRDLVCHPGQRLGVQALVAQGLAQAQTIFEQTMLKLINQGLVVDLGLEQGSGLLQVQKKRL
jgi:hypothetical protein